jgi:hypothetical protein
MWNVEQVAERFREAAGYFNTWPAILREPWETYAAEDGLIRLPPDAAAIERMEETMHWVLWLTEAQRHLVWLRAEERGWRTISRRLGCDRTTAWRRWQRALQAVVAQLNARAELKQSSAVQRVKRSL